MKKHKMLVLMVGGLFVLAACGGPSGTRPDDSGQLIIVQEDIEGMKFVPETIVLTAGQTVRFVIQNNGEKLHEFMIGQNVLRTDDGAANGFEIDFFDTVDVNTMLGEGAMLMIDGEMIMMDMADDEMDMADDDEMDMTDEDMEMAETDEHTDEDMHMGWMIMSEVGSGQTVIEFTVPLNAVGEWEMGCFEDDGSHYEDGMKGTLIVVES